MNFVAVVRLRYDERRRRWPEGRRSLRQGGRTREQSRQVRDIREELALDIVSLKRRGQLYEATGRDSGSIAGLARRARNVSTNRYTAGVV